MRPFLFPDCLRATEPPDRKREKPENKIIIKKIYNINISYSTPFIFSDVFRCPIFFPE